MSNNNGEYLVDPADDEMQRLRVETEHLLAVQRRRTLLKSFAGFVAFTAITVPVGAALTQTSYYTDELATIFSDPEDSMIENFDGCPELPRIPSAESATHRSIKIFDPDIHSLNSEEVVKLKESEQRQKETTSSAKVENPKNLDIFKTIEAIRQLNKYEIASFRSDISGVNINVFSDEIETIGIDEEMLLNIDEVFHSSLDESVEFSNPQIQFAMDCIRERVMNEKEFEGYSINIFIPSNPNVHIMNLQWQDKPTTENVSNGISGGTIAKVRYGFLPFKPSYEEGWIVMSPATDDIYYAGPKTTERLLHESIHFWTQIAGVPFKLTPNEKLVKEIERSTWMKLFGVEFIDQHGDKKLRKSLPSIVDFMND